MPRRLAAPVLAVTTFKDEAEALAIANDTPYHATFGGYKGIGHRPRDPQDCRFRPSGLPNMGPASAGAGAGRCQGMHRNLR